jgi:ABC-type branched-subunit amino acid transport system substrate-binding protein
VFFALTVQINYIEAAGSWGEELADGVLCEIYWDPSIKNGTGIGDTTPQSLIERWDQEYTTPVNKAIGWDYTGSQILFGAIERAGTLDREAVLQAISETWGMPSMFGPIYIDKETQRHDHESQIGQWQLTESGWQQPIVFSYNENMPPTAEMKFREVK